MTIEQRLAESIRSFHVDALAVSVPLNVDLDAALSVLANAVCAPLRRRLSGHDHATLQRRLLSTSGVVINQGAGGTAAPGRPAGLPPRGPASMTDCLSRSCRRCR